MINKSRLLLFFSKCSPTVPYSSSLLSFFPPPNRVAPRSVQLWLSFIHIMTSWRRGLRSHISRGARMRRNERNCSRLFSLSLVFALFVHLKVKWWDFRRTLGFVSRQRKVKYHVSSLLLLLLLRERWAAAQWLRAGATHRYVQQQQNKKIRKPFRRI